MAESNRQKRVTGRVMHEFAHGELKSGPEGKGGPVKSPKQAIAIALNEAGASRFESDADNSRALERTRRKEAKGRTGQQEAEGPAHLGAHGKRESARAMGGSDARTPTAQGEKSARARARKRNGHTLLDLYAEAKRRDITGRSRMSKAQLENALHVR